ncbi:NAD(P)/FAD-dependent oxidoreductase [Gordonia westfalica]|uniref:NAD(P)/FAD-dependent oxidoreductase n=1 Tax=Gordonia westfalica TaxID=158898 RepID=A0ABU2GV34_9ACTN|nr:NAD(P)/FAD-dependent oxidoreductase [Gordonia westfalica]MDS1115328.1 NAD(P)/FAD-dependent oxidoreductase [Gordonia westfalica]
MGTAVASYDDVIIGAGHNGLTAAAYLARAGRRVLVLEKADHVGGATVSAMPFSGLSAHLSRFSYLVSLMPREIIADLDLDISLIRRRYSSYTPLPSDPTRGILIDTQDDDATAQSFRRVLRADHVGADPVGYSPAGFVAWQSFYRRVGTLARRVFPTLIEPLRTAADMHELAVGTDTSDAELWEALTTLPLGTLLGQYFDDDLLRGIAATDGLIGTFADLDDPSLRQNICFLYHVIGGGTGDWDVPVGGMGAVSGALYQAATSSGAEICTGVTVTGVDPADGTVEFSDRAHGARTVRGSVLYAACAPQVLNTLIDDPIACEAHPRGSQLKINLLLDRLPRLRDESVSPEAAFAGTFHINETATQLHEAFRQARRGEVPDLPPCEIYCHTLSDRSILGPELDGKHTLTLFGLHMPPDVFDEPGAVEHAVGATFASLNMLLAEPIQDVIAHDLDGRPCIEAKTPQDLEEMLGLPGGNIFHQSLRWPWAETASEVGTWGVETRHPRLLLCGAGARRGGGVSGIPGRNAAAAVLGAEAFGFA